jgi:hypothetical protein
MTHKFVSETSAIRERLEEMHVASSNQDALKILVWKRVKTL